MDRRPPAGAIHPSMKPCEYGRSCSGSVKTRRSTPCRYCLPCKGVHGGILMAGQCCGVEAWVTCTCAYPCSYGGSGSRIQFSCHHHHNGYLYRLGRIILTITQSLYFRLHFRFCLLCLLPDAQSQPRKHKLGFSLPLHARSRHNLDPTSNHS